MSTLEIIEFVKNHPSGKVNIAFTDIDGILRGKYIATEKFLGVAENGLSVCDVIFGWDVADVAYDNAAYTGWHSGYPDTPASIDLATFRKIPWENDLPFFLGDMSESQQRENFVCP